MGNQVKKELALEWARHTLPRDVRFKFFRAYFIAENDRQFSIENPIFTSFNHVKSIEGNDYWYRVHENIKKDIPIHIGLDKLLRRSKMVSPVLPREETLFYGATILSGIPTIIPLGFTGHGLDIAYYNGDTRELIETIDPRKEDIRHLLKEKTDYNKHIIWKKHLDVLRSYRATYTIRTK